MSPELSVAPAPTAPEVAGVRQRLGAAPGGSSCANCGAAVTDRYCGRCGQRLEHEIRSVWQFSREATEDLTHADSRLWSTLLALLFKPGFLTREFLSGRRVRYLPPLRLYLIVSVLFFLVVGSLHDQVRVVQLRTGGGETSVRVVPAQEIGVADARPGESPQQRADRICNTDYDGPLRGFFKPLLLKSCRAVMQDNGRTLSEAFVHYLPRAMFVFLPALALVMKLMYRRPRRYYVEHLLFFLHNHAFAFLLLGLLMLLAHFASPPVGKALTDAGWLYIAYYLFVSMRRVYGQSRLVTLTKLAILSFAYLAGALVTLALTAMYSVYSI